jgi:hypothetical protein
MMNDETWMDADEALTLGFCDETDAAIEVAACARSLDKGDISWKTAAGSSIFSRTLGAKMPEAAKKVPLTLIAQPTAAVPVEAPQNQNLEGETVLDIKNTADLEKAFPQLVTEIRDAADTAAREQGVQAERARLKALDGLIGPGREAIIAKAKYEEPKDARDIAMDLLQASNAAAALEARQSDAAAVNVALAPSATPTSQAKIDDVAAKVANEINEMRGYKVSTHTP